MDAGPLRDKLYHQRAKYRRALAEGRTYTPENPKFTRNTTDPDSRTKNDRVKLHLIEQRLDHELQDSERQRLNRKKNRLRAKLYNGLRPGEDKPETLNRLLEEINGGMESGS